MIIPGPLTKGSVGIVGGKNSIIYTPELHIHCSKDEPEKVRSFGINGHGVRLSYNLEKKNCLAICQRRNKSFQS